MTMIAIDDLVTETRSLEEIVESPTIVPRGAKGASNEMEAHVVDDLLRDKTASYSPLAR